MYFEFTFFWICILKWIRIEIDRSMYKRLRVIFSVIIKVWKFSRFGFSLHHSPQECSDCEIQQEKCQLRCFRAHHRHTAVAKIWCASTSITKTKVYQTSSTCPGCLFCNPSFHTSIFKGPCAFLWYVIKSRNISWAHVTCYCSN